ncbi:hypothetical protein PRIPAC_74505 [Pristionchus pacificus]|uniref:Uncharacterized protein n=1 Tax=Pristionchus pacificus TaxID=54126 RepID=A0A2A6D0G9_PRIPA|nr:hypothetical protein PRIPAC_74505 [Pristionchus pacificus]|eukprot:PDM83773.1 hypothetical protein PRIPAC_30260 [Pristionchus pacificus]
MSAPAIGIDLGTTFSAVSYVDRGDVVVIQNNAGHEITPSVVHFDEDIVLVGEEAVKKRKDGAMNTIFNIKRLMGRKHDDVFIQQRKWPFEILRGSSERACVRVDAEVYSPEQISAFILNYIKRIAKKVLLEEPVDAVITVPANFTNAQREATRDAGRMAGFNVLQIVNEPTAAAIAFCEQNDEPILRVLVFDLGGGTFDVSIVEIEGKRTKVLATDGLTSLGGIDFDERIYEEALARFQEMGIKITGLDWTLMEACENAKKALSKRNSARISHPHYGGAGFDLTYSTFVELCEDLLEQTLTLTEKVLVDASIDEDLIDEIMLVGGSTRIRRVQEILAERFPNTKIRDDIEPELAVAKGAAILADALSKLSSDDASFAEEDTYPIISLIDVTPLPLGMTLDGDRCKVLIPKNTRCPFTTYQYCTNVFDYEEKLTIEILEGDNSQASLNNTLAKVEIGINPKPKGQNLIKVILSIDVNGILNVKAIDKDTNEEVAVTIRSEKLDDFEIVKMTQELTSIRQGG